MMACGNPHPYMGRSGMAGRGRHLPVAGRARLTDMRHAAQRKRQQCGHEQQRGRTITRDERPRPRDPRPHNHSPQPAIRQV